MMPVIVTLAFIVLGRALLSSFGETLAQRAATRTSAQLREALLAHVVRLGPVWLSGERRGQVATLATRGVDSVEPYVARYIPQLVIAAVVPLTVGVAILTQDLLAAVIVAVTAPLIPVFMILIGRYTQSATAKQWSTLGVLSGHFLDVVAGLPTLKAFGRERVQATRMAQIDKQYRTATLGVLRIAFLSSLVLELVATLAVAVVAVSIGLRLVNGEMDLRTGLVVLILAPEVYLPIRAVGAQFHAAADGIDAAEQVFEMLAIEPAITGTRIDVPVGEIVVDDVTVTYPGTDVVALAPISLTLVPGRVTAVVGPSGVGKSTLLAVLLGSLAIGCGVGLLATSAWLISSAALKPQILELEVAIVAVRAFGIGRGVFRYGERLVSHDAAFRALSRLRLAVYDRLAVVAPAGVPAYRRGDLLERLVRDVDATQDLPLRVLVPYASGAVVALASVVLAFAILPAAGVVLAVSLLLAATVVPWITSRSAADAERATAPARGELNGDVLTLLDGVADLTMSGATKAWLDRLAADDLLIGRLAARRARAAGVAAGLGVLLSGGAVVAMLLVAIPAVRSGELVGVNLAVLVLLPLATYEAVVAMPTAALALGRVRGSAQRVVEVLDAVDPVPDPALPVDPPVGVVGVRISGLRAGWHEPAFRQEVLAACVLLPLAFWLGRQWTEVALLAGSVLLVMIVELLNTGLETAIDRIGPEWHDLSKRAKDMGSAAVLLSLVLAGGIWMAAIFQRFA